MTERCTECDAEVKLDEPQTCYFTGRGPCGDCRDPQTGQPPYAGGCFKPLLCDDCKTPPPVQQRERRRKEIDNMIATRDYRNGRREQLRAERTWK